MTGAEKIGSKTKADTRFKPGNKGKPKGARHKKTVLVESMFAEGGLEVVQAVISAAKAGDMSAARLVVERIYPAPKGRRLALELPEVKTASDVVTAFGGVLGAMADGEITPDEAATIAGVLETKRKAIETLEIERRIAALEAKES